MDATMLAMGVVIVVAIVLIYYYGFARSSSGGAFTPSPIPSPIHSLSKIGNSFNQKGTSGDIQAAGRMQQEFQAFADKAKGGDVRGALESLNNAIEALQMIEPDTISTSITHSHSQACMPPKIRRDLADILNELHRTSLLTSGLASWAQNIAGRLPTCPAPSGMPEPSGML